MRLGGNRAVLLVITENIEMKLFSSEERCVTVTTQEKREQNKHEQGYQRYRHLEHPLAPDPEEEELEFQTPPSQQPERRPSIQELPYHPHTTGPPDDSSIEMESFPPFRLTDIELVEIKSTDSAIFTKLSSEKNSHVKWKKPSPPKLGLVVKDVICLTRELYKAQLEGQFSPQSKGHSAQAMELTTRITIDSNWSAAQMENRLALLFHKHFKEKTGRRFSFTYLQSLPGSRVLFVPNTPEEGWTGEQVLKICGHGALYILSHHGSLQEEFESLASEKTKMKRRNSSSENSKENKSQLVEQICTTPEKLTLDLDTILRLFRAENVTEDVETPITVRRVDVLGCVLKEVKKPEFCFSSTPVICFDEQDPDDSEEAHEEFFRLILRELQQSCVFEGRPGSLFFTHDLTALDDRKYYEAGVLIGWSLTHGGRGPCLHPALYQLMCCQNPSLKNFSWRDIVDPEAQMRLRELHSCSDVKQLSPSLCDWVSHCGIPGIYSAHSYEISTIYACLVKHYIYHRVASMVSQFTEGLNSCGGLWDLVKCHWETFLPVMTGKEQRPLTLEEFKELFTFCYSHADSKLRAGEEATVSQWETVLTFVRDGQAHFSFEDLLIFITGDDHLPPLGFSKQISLRFYTQDADSVDIKLPHTSAGSLELFLPRGVEEAPELLGLLNRALLDEQKQRDRHRSSDSVTKGKPPHHVCAAGSCEPAGF
ncbi:G2/M phase-specific E3 ubiquitin-protein ligase [Austrofundulus limnaeus]|uniref:G2/M phase-specific E3 ubiquitin-protein ligase n=1 Tax=Austrofundulus limnaeus TaxID=52670 RepID=A0A2I4CYY7_AUSLI|nr:PREDICTED: G2/M phase-specific E3 ubiquitin-protein ligase-like [Austrofundulus limnaeus]